MTKSKMFGLFEFEYNAKGRLIESLIIASSLKKNLVAYHKNPPKQRLAGGLGGKLLMTRPAKDVYSFKRGGVYSGFFIDEIDLVVLTTSPKRVEKKKT